MYNVYVLTVKYWVAYLFKESRPPPFTGIMNFEQFGICTKKYHKKDLEMFWANKEQLQINWLL